MKNNSEFNLMCGKRLRMIRDVFNYGKKLTSLDFAEILDETRDKIANYESGRSQIPIGLLQELYQKGINPTFIVTGVGEIFAHNKKGKELKKIIDIQVKIDSEIAEKMQRIEIENERSREHNEIERIKAAAGDMK